MVKLEIIGNLTADPTVREVEYASKETGEIIKTNVCSFTVAADHGFGERKTTTFFKVNAWRGLGDACMKALKKGRGVFVIGPVIQNNYVDKNNNLRSVMELRAEEVHFLYDGRKVATPSVEEDEPEDEMLY